MKTVIKNILGALKRVVLSIFSVEDYNSHWQWYKGFFNLIILRYLIIWFALVPIAATLLGDFPDTYVIAGDNGQEFPVNLKFPFNWKLLWLSSFFYFLALIIYKFRCPELLKKYSSLGDYKKHQHFPRWIPWLSESVVSDKQELKKFFCRLNVKGYLEELGENAQNELLPVVKVEGSRSVLYFIYENKSYSLGMPILDQNGKVDNTKTEVAEADIFWEVFGRFSSSRRNSRRTIRLLLLASLLCAAFPISQNIIVGLRYVLGI